MLQSMEYENREDDQGRPAGGFVRAVGLRIEWQDGPLVDAAGVRQEPSGAFVETVIAAALQRIRYYQATQFACEENAYAQKHLELALDALEARTRRRTEQGVEGRHEGS